MKRKILIVNPISLFPTYAMNQVRTLHMAKNLITKFDVEVVTPVKDDDDLEKSIAGFIKTGIVFHPLKSLKPSSDLLKKRFYQVMERVNYYLFGTDLGFTTGKRYGRSIIRLIRDNNYDYVISNYWEVSDFFRKIPSNTVKILDTHYAVKENLEVFRKNGYKTGIPFFKNRELEKSLAFEKRIARASDIILSLSLKCYSLFSNDFPDKKHLLIADGNDVEHYASVENKPEGNVILFYGSMSSPQNVGAFKRAYKFILPLIKQKVPDAKMIVVGNKPPVEIQQLHNGNDMIVTGFVEDVRPWLSKGKLLILPLEIGSGFRGRIVEVMSMGLPVVGTHNALDSLEMESGVQGLISDDDHEMADYCVRLLTNETFRLQQSDACRKFVREKYSLEATFGKLTEFLLSN